MGDRLSSLALIRRAAAMYDGDVVLRDAARGAWRGGFSSGAAWMALGLARCRGESSLSAVAVPRDCQRLGMIKYVLAGTAMFVMIAGGIILRSRWPLLLAPCAFYLVEVQMLFLFPVALDGSSDPFRDSLRCMRQAGGTLSGMRRVIVFAAVMLLGGFAGRGFVRCWCLGCLAVCIWYEQVARRTETST